MITIQIMMFSSSDDRILPAAAWPATNAIMWQQYLKASRASGIQGSHSELSFLDFKFVSIDRSRLRGAAPWGRPRSRRTPRPRATLRPSGTLSA